MLPPDPPLIALIILIILIAGIVQGLVGFGSGLVMVPLFVLFFEPRIVVPVALLHGLIMNGILSINLRGRVQKGVITPILIAAMIGIPFGAAILFFIDQEYLKILIGIVIVIFGSIFLSGRTFNLRNNGRTSILVGWISGLLNGSISMSGPPVILFFSNQRLRKRNFRANLVFYFFLLNILTLIIFWFIGLIDLRILIMAGILLPFALVGIYIGAKTSHHVNEVIFRRIALILVVTAGVSSLVSGILGLV